MNLLDKIQEKRAAREHTTQVANQLLYIFNDYQDHDIYENIHAAVDYMISYNKSFDVKVPRDSFLYEITLSSVFDAENMIKLERQRKVSKLNIVLHDFVRSYHFNLFECYLEINSSIFDESTLDINITHATKDLPPFVEMYGDSSVLGELLVRFFTDVDDKIIKTEDYEFELK